MLPNKKRKGRDLTSQKVKRKSAVFLQLCETRVRPQQEDIFKLIHKVYNYKRMYVDICTNPFGFVFTIRA